MKHLYRNKYTNADISSANQMGTYIAQATQVWLVQVYLGGLTAGGEYSVWLTRALKDDWPPYKSNETTVTLDANLGEDTVFFASESLPVAAGDSVRVYAKGMESDTAVKAFVDIFALSDLETPLAEAQAELESLASQVSGIASALSAATINVVSALDGSEITVYRHATWVVPILLDGDYSESEEIWFSVKSSAHDTDDEALMQVSLNEGLLRWNGAEPGDSADGILSRTVADGETTLSVWVHHEITGEVEPVKSLVWDLKHVDEEGNLEVIATGEMNVLDAVTRRIEYESGGGGGATPA